MYASASASAARNYCLPPCNMKQIFLHVLVALLICTGCENNITDGSAASLTEPSKAGTDSLHLRDALIARCGALEIIPTDESATDTSLLSFITHLKQVVLKKDTAALLTLIGPGTITSHGGGLAGKKDFIEHWQLYKKPHESEVWLKLERAISLGGCFDKGFHKPDFIMPYLQASHYFEKGCDFDWYVTYVCLSPSTKIYEKPDKASKVIAELKYNILESDYDSKTIGSFIPVYTVGKSVQGYVHEQDVYLCADYMLVIGKEHGAWEIKDFSPFD